MCRHDLEYTGKASIWKCKLCKKMFEQNIAGNFIELHIYEVK